STLSCSYYPSVLNSENYSLFHKYQSTVKNKLIIPVLFFPMFVLGTVFFLPCGKDPGEAPCSNLFLDFVLPRDKQD
ncbi:MAG: hypothetical protein ACK559_16050, partial [bacterium]